MGWRENMGTESKNEHFKTYIQKVQKVQKGEKKEKNKAFVPFVGFVGKSQEVKNLQNEITYLWEKAWKLADWIDDPESKIPWQERTKYVSEVLKMGREIDNLKA